MTPHTYTYSDISRKGSPPPTDRVKCSCNSYTQIYCIYCIENENATSKLVYCAANGPQPVIYTQLFNDLTFKITRMRRLWKILIAKE